MPVHGEVYACALHTQPRVKAWWFLGNNNFIYVYLSCIYNHCICHSGQLYNDDLPFLSTERGLALARPLF